MQIRITGIIKKKERNKNKRQKTFEKMEWLITTGVKAQCQNRWIFKEPMAVKFERFYSLHTLNIEITTWSASGITKIKWIHAKVTWSQLGKVNKYTSLVSSKLPYELFLKWNMPVTKTLARGIFSLSNERLLNYSKKKIVQKQFKVRDG